MARTTSRTVKFSKLKGDKEAGAIVVKLMIACNDLQFANEALSEWKKEQSLRRVPRQNAAKMYFLRLQIGHLYEALEILKQIQNNTLLNKLAHQCDKQTQDSFKYLEPYFQKGTAECKRFELVIGIIRNSLVFHYDERSKSIQRAIDDRANRQEANYSSVTRGSETYLWHFKAAEDIVNSIIARQVWQIPHGTDLSDEVEKIIEEIYPLFLHFMDFSGEFIWKYFEA